MTTSKASQEKSATSRLSAYASEHFNMRVSELNFASTLRVTLKIIESLKAKAIRENDDYTFDALCVVSRSVRFELEQSKERTETERQSLLE